MQITLNTAYYPENMTRSLTVNKTEYEILLEALAFYMENQSFGKNEDITLQFEILHLLEKFK